MFAVTTDKKMAVFHGGDMQRDTPNQQTPPDTYASRVSLILVTRGLLDKPTGGVTNTMDKAPLGALLTDGLGGGDLNAQCWTLVDWRRLRCTPLRPRLWGPVWGLKSQGLFGSWVRCFPFFLFSYSNHGLNN